MGEQRAQSVDLREDQAGHPDEIHASWRDPFLAAASVSVRDHEPAYPARKTVASVPQAAKPRRDGDGAAPRQTGRPWWVALRQGTASDSGEAQAHRLVPNSAATLCGVALGPQVVPSKTEIPRIAQCQACARGVRGRKPRREKQKGGNVRWVPAQRWSPIRAQRERSKRIAAAYIEAEEKDRQDRNQQRGMSPRTLSGGLPTLGRGHR
jgi:hypothetical protein